MRCHDCKAAGIEAAATRTHNGKGYCSSHARKYFPMGAALPPQSSQIAQIEKWVDESAEKEGMTMGRLDSQAILADHNAGMSDIEIAKKYGCHFTSVNAHLRKMGINRRGSGPRRPRKAQAIAKTAIDGLEDPGVRLAASRHARHPVPLAVAEKSTGEAPVPQVPQAASNGHARCRVAMFEVEGDATSVQHAVDAIKAALEKRI